MGTDDPLFRVAGIGASAGGLAALIGVLSAIRTDGGLSIVVLQHQAESRAGKLAALLAPVAPVPVLDAASGTRLRPDHVYVVPPHMRASLVGDVLVLEGPTAASPHQPIDALLTSLAALGPRAIGVVLSGSADDGSEGIRAIKAAGGLTIAQDPKTAEFDQMPRNAIATGTIDHIWPAERIGRELATARVPDPRTGPNARILELLRELAGIDFSMYKRPTIERRLERQLARHHLATLDEYADYLAAHPAEARALYEDLLVHVTEFFREREGLDVVIRHALPEILAAKDGGTPLRVWVPGCSSGEEVYSFAMLLLEALESHGDMRAIQMFGTDLSERAVAVARAGRYPATIAEQVGEERLKRFFVPDGAGFRIATHVRERCLFVRHDMGSDPPFSRVDLVSCRNVLIYLGHPLQARVLALLHYALEQPGFLLVGTAESVANQDALFERVVPGMPLYRRKPTATRMNVILGSRPDVATRLPELVNAAADVYRAADHVLLARYAPACVLVDENFDIVKFRGRTGAFLEPAPGHPQLNVFKMARDSLGPELRSAAQRAQRDDVPVRVEGIAIGERGHEQHVDIEVIPVRAGPTPRHFLVIFETRAPTRPARKQRVRRGTADRVEQLEHELAATREYLSSVIGQHVATAQELGVLNEELQSANEELQSTNEELLTAKEELQSTNDELQALNKELERGNVALRTLNDDLVNVLASVDVAIIIVDSELAVRRYTPKARALFKLIDGDIGRPIADLQPAFAIADLASVIRGVIDTLAVDQREVRDAAGNIYRMQMRPYRTASHQIAGAVISFVDITELRTSIEATTRAHGAELEAREALRREKDALLNAVSHELRTPLSAILLWTAVIRDVPTSTADVLRAAATIEASARAEAQLVDDLLDLALSQTNRDALVIAAQVIAPCPVVEEVVASLGVAADDKDVAIALDLDHDARMLADPRRLRQIAWHLVTNAIKFTPAGGRVDVRVTRSDGLVELAVRDTGKGIRTEFLARVFEAFSQEDPSSTREYPGLGIGLAFVRHLVDRQRGTITVTSGGDGKGATFTVQLPAA